MQINNRVVSAESAPPAKHVDHEDGCDSANTQWKEKLRNGTTVTIRRLRADDVELERRFIEELSPQSRRFRFLGEIKSPSPSLLKQLTQLDSTHDIAYVALIFADGADKRVIGVSRFSARPDGLTCECAVTVSDAWHNQGLATILMRHLIDAARRRGIECMYSVDAAGNDAMRELAEHFGFTRKPDPNDATQVLHTLDLKAATV
ncbi:MAG: GNAT family N-acetyltransferase [Rudaea sp.]|nr:GNAT family N-acetyltransferase [Rudaea sp.]